MKFFFVFCILLSPFFSTGKQVFADEKASDLATLIVYRNKFSPPFTSKPMIRINGKKSFYLPRGHHGKLTLSPGKYEVMADWKIIHGMPDKSVNIELKSGEAIYINVSTRVGFVSVAGATFSSDIVSAGTEAKDLSKSILVTRFDPSWKTLNQKPSFNEKYNLYINESKFIEDFNLEDDQGKLFLVRQLLKKAIYTERILDAVAKQVEATYKKDYINKVEYTPIAYMCKYLASSKLSDYQPLLDDVRIKAKHKRLRKYAKRYLETYYGLYFEKKK